MSDQSKPPIPTELVILQEIAKKLGYMVVIVDEDNQNLIQVTDPLTQKSFFASNTGLGTFPLNSHNTVGLTKDKLWAKLVLDRAGFKTVDARPVFTRANLQEKRAAGYEIGDTLRWASTQKFPLFIKPNKGSHGTNASFVWSLADLEEKITAISFSDYLALLGPVIQRPEYRIFVLKGEIVFSYKREQSKLIGDGQNTVRHLLQNCPSNVNEKSPYIAWQLQKLEIGLDDILPQGHPLKLTECSNLAQGGQATDVRFSHDENLQNWCRSIMAALGSQICGIDVFSGPNGLDDIDQLSIIEVNGNPGLAGLYYAGYPEKVQTIWQQILESYFQKIGA